MTVPGPLGSQGQQLVVFPELWKDGCGGSEGCLVFALK